MNGSSVEHLMSGQSVIVVDGGLATELEHAGHRLDDPLWSAKLLIEAPEDIERVHFDYLNAGADCITSASYQATLSGFENRGFSRGQAEDLLVSAVELACRARDRFVRTMTPRTKRLKPVVAASIGPYGACLEDGSEYRGNYGLDETALFQFHLPRWELLCGSGADLVAFETIPSWEEACAIRRLILSAPEHRCWISFSAMDGSHIADGTEMRRVRRLFRDLPQVVALGMNCTSPENIDHFCALGFDEKPLIVYPNSGETYDPGSRGWRGVADLKMLATRAIAWQRQGARFIGGCCRTGPDHIRALRHALFSVPDSDVDAID